MAEWAQPGLTQQPSMSSNTRGTMHQECSPVCCRGLLHPHVSHRECIGKAASSVVGPMELSWKGCEDPEDVGEINLEVGVGEKVSVTQEESDLVEGTRNQEVKSWVLGNIQVG